MPVITIRWTCWTCERECSVTVTSSEHEVAHRIIESNTCNCIVAEQVVVE